MRSKYLPFSKRWRCCGSLRENKETHLLIGQDEIVNKIEFRISRYTFLPGPNGEPLHVMYTTPGHGYGVLLSHLVALHATGRIPAERFLSSIHSSGYAEMARNGTVLSTQCLD